MERGCREREERCKEKDRKRKEVTRVREERGRHRQTIKMDDRKKKQIYVFYSCIISCLYALTTLNLGSHFACHARNKTSEIFRCHKKGTAQKGRRVQA